MSDGVQHGVQEADGPEDVRAESGERDGVVRLGRKRGETPEEKLQAVLEAASIAEEDLGGWLRQRGLRSEDLAEFRAAAISGLAAKAPRPSVADQKRIKELEQDLKRSKAALAETAALLVLRKKAVALWGEEGDDT